MQTAKIPENEQSRLDALYEYNVLDTLPEKQLDDLTYLAATICDTEIALISLVDKERQWFKSKVGLDADETSRDIAFCAHAILEQDVFLVEDTSKDQRFIDNPLVTSGPSIKFYAGAPLKSPDGNSIGTLCVIDSKTKTLSKQQTEALQALSRQVIAQFELTKNLRVLKNTKLELEESISELKQMSEYKSRFISSVSHEIRTPLNGILGLSRMLAETPEASQYSADTHAMLDLMQLSAANLADMVNHVLDLSRLESGKLTTNPEPVLIKDIFDEVVRTNWPRASQKNVQVNYHIDETLPSCISIDKIKVVQILMNLTGNAVKFTPKNKTVILKAGREKGQLEIKVLDEGIGIAEQDFDKLFMPFQQIDASNNGVYIGSGLGLTITKELVDFLGGSIQVSSEYGKGACFTVLLPLIETSENHRDRLNDTELPVYLGRRVLIIEDNRVNQLVAKATLTKYKLDVVVAADGASGVAAAIAENPDFILCDIRLPDFDGFDVVKQLKQHPATKSIPIAFLSADISSESLGKAKELEVLEFLKKPLDELELRRTLDLAFNP